MKFRTNTEMILHYCEELLEDGQDHGIPEIREYVNQKTGCKGVAGAPLPPHLIGMTLYNHFTAVSRGVYRKIEAAPVQAPPSETEKLLHGLSRVDEELSKALTLNYCDLPLTGEKLQELFAIGIQIRTLIRQARELAALEPPIIKAEQPASVDQDRPGQDAKGPGMGLTM